MVDIGSLDQLGKFLLSLCERNGTMQRNVVHLMVENMKPNRDETESTITTYLRPGCFTLPSLKTLDISNPYCLRESSMKVFLDEWLSVLPQFPVLELLVLRGFNADNMGTLHFPELPQLLELHLYNCSLGDDAFISGMLGKVPRLRVLLNLCSIYRMPEGAYDACGASLETLGVGYTWDSTHQFGRMPNLRHLKFNFAEVVRRGRFSREFSDLAGSLETLELMVDLNDAQSFPRGPAEIENDPKGFRDLQGIVADLEAKCRGGEFKKLRVIDIRDFSPEFFNGVDLFPQVRGLLEGAAARLKEVGVTLLHDDFPDECRHQWRDDYSEDDKEDIEEDDEEDDEDDEEDDEDDEEDDEEGDEE
jgi:hypothetical protein